MKMVERMARAICLTDSGAPSEDDSWFREVWESERHPYENCALAALKAMREPTQAMLYAAEDADERSRKEFPSGESGPAISASNNDTWLAMIDAAIKEAEAE